jgi:hypothetical protein
MTKRPKSPVGFLAWFEKNVLKLILILAFLSAGGLLEAQAPRGEGRDIALYVIFNNSAKPCYTKDAPGPRDRTRSTNNLGDY